MTILKTKMLSNQLHTLGLLKVENVQIWINKQPNYIQLTPVGSVPGVKNMNTLIPISLV